VRDMDESRIIIEMLVNDNWQSNWIGFINCDKLINLAIENKVLSTFSHWIFENNIESYFKNTTAYPLIVEALLLNERDIRAYEKVLNLLYSEFSKIGIDICLLKGLSLKGKRPRDMGDLDILIHDYDLKKAIVKMEELGFSYQGYIRNDRISKREARNWDKQLLWNNQFQFLDPNDDLLVEIHTNLFERRRVYKFNLDPLLNGIEDFWTRSINSSELHCPVLSVEDRLWLLCLHNSTHRTAVSNSFVLRTVLDMINLINSEHIDWISLFKRSRETDTLVFVIYSLEMINFFLPGIIPEKTISSGNRQLNAPKQIMKKIMHKCYNDLERSHYFYKFLFSLILPFVQKSFFFQKFSSILILPTLFPSSVRLRHIYGLPKGSPLVIFTYFIEPFRWISVAVFVLFKKK